MEVDPQLAKHLVTVGASVWGSKELIGKVLGPTAEYLGGEIRNFAAKCNINISDVFAKAARKLGPRLDEPGQVNPRVLKGVLDEAAFAEDEVASEYFGGVLAASRSVDGADDRGVAFVGLVRDLSTLQLRFHYLCYSWLRQLFLGQQLEIGIPSDRRNMRLFISIDAFRAAMMRNGAPDDQSLVDHCVLGLARQGLIDSGYVYGSTDHVRSAWPKAPSPGALITPTPFGAELFLWAHGWGTRNVNEFLSTELTFEGPLDCAVPAGVCAVPDEAKLDQLRSSAAELAEEIQRFAKAVDRAKDEAERIPALPLAVKRHCDYFIEEVRQHVHPVAAIRLERYLDDYLYPADESTLETRIESLKSLASVAVTMLKESGSDKGTA